VVYGSPYEEFKEQFITKLDEVLSRWQGATLIGGTLTWLGAKKIRIMG
jgi:hypothetical protein